MILHEIRLLPIKTDDKGISMYCSEYFRTGYEVTILVTDTEAGVKTVCIGKVHNRSHSYVYNLCDRMVSNLTQNKIDVGSNYLRHFEFNMLQFTL